MSFCRASRVYDNQSLTTKYVYYSVLYFGGFQTLQVQILYNTYALPLSGSPVSVFHPFVRFLTAVLCYGTTIYTFHVPFISFIKLSYYPNEIGLKIFLAALLSTF